MSDDKKPSKKEARETLNGAVFIEKLFAVIESRAGRLLGAMHQPGKEWLTTERGTALHKRLTSIIATLQAAQALIEANIPRPKAPEQRSIGLLDLLGSGTVVGLGHRDCNDEECPEHGSAVKARKRSVS